MRAQHVDDRDSGRHEGGYQRGGQVRGQCSIGRVDDERRTLDVVPVTGRQQNLDGLGRLLGASGGWQVETRVEGRLCAEREQHERVLRPEAQDDGHGGEQVLRPAGGERGGHDSTLPIRADRHRSRRD